MPFEDQETSRDEAKPIELYKIYLGDTVVERYTSYQTQIFQGGSEYLPLPGLERTPVTIVRQGRFSNMTIRMPASTQIVTRYINNAPSQPVRIEISRFHADDPALEERLLVVGMLRAISITDGGRKAQLEVSPQNGGFTKTIPSDLFSSQCQNDLGDSTCQFVHTAPTHIAQNVLVTEESAENLTIPGISSYNDGWFTGGFVETPQGDRRLILSHEGTAIRIMVPFEAPVQGTSVSVYSGCDHRPTTCRGKFQNLVNFRGFPYIPSRDPHTGGP